ncbi:hypothetical protein ARMGADRAFT_1040643 [Armillaria gallica]|uniref:Uncharacterized protein n=1 Tax=Armillaria gallica TaxID=47427 RepID=A0A2H3CMK7_ARMGA|nr:hypothetical protein ARMGADRAFT_1040643 [Armillaria gallica]
MNAADACGTGSRLGSTGEARSGTAATIGESEDATVSLCGVSRRGATSRVTRGIFKPSSLDVVLKTQTPHDVPASMKLMLMVIYWILSIEKGRQSYLEQTYHGSCFSLPTVTRRNPIVQRLSGPLFKCASRRKAAQRYNVALSSDLNAGGRYSFEEISKHLKVLLRNAKPGQSLMGWDGRLGAALDSQVLLVTPNASILFQPPMGATREITLRENCRYGQDDHLLWLQPYSPKRPHLGCIQKAPIDIRFQPLYSLPQCRDFEELNTCSAITGPGLWSSLKFAQFQGTCDLVLRDIETGTWNEPHKSLIRTYQTYIEMFLEQIEGLPLVFERLKAIMDYVSVYQPRIIGASPRPPEDGIPVWVIYPLASAPTICIDALDEIQEPAPPFIALSKSRLRVRPVYIGSATDDDKYKAIKTYTHSHLMMANPFLSSTALQAPSAPVPAMPSSTQERYEPCWLLTFQDTDKRSNLSQRGKEKSSNKASSANATFKVMTHSHLAPLINTWKLGLQRVNAAKERPPCCAMGFTLPRPELFITVQTDAKFRLMITLWLRLHQTWRTILQIHWLDEQSQGFSSSSRARDICEILWELAEMNFRIEFQALDRKLCGNESIRHQMLIGRCFSNGKVNMLHRVPLCSTNYGLAHSNWLERAPYIFAMRRCMQQWNNCPSLLSPSSDQKGGYSESEVEVIEQEMAYFYAESFFMNFGREPIFPRNLTHTPDVTYVPEQQEQAQAAHPGFYLDISQWEDS